MDEPIGTCRLFCTVAVLSAGPEDVEEERRGGVGRGGWGELVEHDSRRNGGTVQNSEFDR